MPEPLTSGVPENSDNAGDDEAVQSPPVEPRKKARPYSQDSPLPDDLLKRGPGAGFEMQLQIAWPEAKKSVLFEREERQTWPNVRVQLLREVASRPARMRWILEGVAFPFPPGTEVRARADRIGHLILWPDQRSYRILPQGALHSVFADRRVDRMPFVEPDSISVGEGNRLGKRTVKKTIASAVGTALMDYVEVKELPYASELLCRALLEVVRLKSTAETCPEGHLPVHFEMKWPSEKLLVISVLSWGALPNLNPEDFRTPPDLPIFKRGELPPFDDYFLNADARQALLPLSTTRAAPLPPPAPPQVAEPATAPVEGPAVMPQPGPPRNQISLKNVLHRPLVVFMNKVPFKWMPPASETLLYITSPEVRVSARDFLGEVVFDEQILVAPAELRFFAEVDKAPATAFSPPP